MTPAERALLITIARAVAVIVRAVADSSGGGYHAQKLNEKIDNLIQPQ